LSAAPHPGMPSPTTPGSWDIHEFQCRDVDIGLRDGNNGSTAIQATNVALQRRGHH
jgi:hypothetical protein